MMRVLEALAADPVRWRHGYDLSSEVHLKSGSMYPLLVRLADRGLLDAAWEAGAPGKPPRHLYRLSAAGLAEAAGLATARRSAERGERRSASARGRLREA